MKRLLAFSLVLLMVSGSLPAFSEGKLDSMPDIFRMSVNTRDRLEGKQEKYVYVEELNTSHAGVNAGLREAEARLEAALYPLVESDPHGKAKNNSRLDVEANYARTGHSWMSVLLIGRVSWRRAQTALMFEAHAYDLENGKRLALPDLFPEGSAGWELLASRTEEHLNSIFPGEERDQEAIRNAVRPEALREAAFTLSGGQLTLHYLARDFGFKEPVMVHVRFFYPELMGMLSEEAARQTDNSHWKKVALTFDDGPRFFMSVNTLNAVRLSGAKATFFVNGNQFEDGIEILRREFDGNYQIGNHTFSHKSGYALKPDALVRQVTRNDEVTLKVIGEAARVVRAPGGLWPPWLEAGIGRPLIQWSVDTYDYTGKDAPGILYSVRKYAQDGDIILLHDTRPNTRKAVPLIMEYLDNNGFMTLTVEELAWMEGVTLAPNTVYARFLDGRYDERKDSNLN